MGGLMGWMGVMSLFEASTPPKPTLRQLSSGFGFGVQGFGFRI